MFDVPNVTCFILIPAQLLWKSVNFIQRNIFLRISIAQKEARKRKDEVNTKEVKPYIIKLLNDIENINKEERTKAADDALALAVKAGDKETIQALRADRAAVGRRRAPPPGR